MKLNLLINGRDVRSGYLNLDPLAVPGDGKVRASLGDLSPFVDDAEASEIVAVDVIDRLPPGDVNPVLDHWAAKLGRGGVLSVGGLDLQEVARKVAQRRLDNDAANALIYGGQSAPWDCRRAAISLPLACGLLERRGLKVLRKNIDDNFYCVTARRP